MSWQKIIPNDELVDGMAYYLTIAYELNGIVVQWMYWSSPKSGKQGWSTKPGIAINIICGDKLRECLSKNPNWHAIEIPKDANKRWRRRE